MHPYLESHRIIISTLGPVHVGDGQDIEPGEYLIKEGVLYEIPHDRLASALTPQQRDQLNRLLLQNGRNMLVEVQRFFKDNAESFLPHASHATPVSGEMSEFYEDRLGQIQQGPARRGGAAGLNKLEIKRQVRNPITQKPYLPGSTIKGAIRTAVLDALNAGQSPRPPHSRYRDARKEASGYLEKALIGYEKVDQDPFKHLKVSDASWHSSRAPQEIMFAVNRPKNSGGKASMAQEKGLYNVLECLGPARPQALKGDIRLEARPGQAGVLGKMIPDVFSLAKLCNRFYQPMLEEELDRLEKRGCYNRYCFDDTKNWANTLREVLAGPLKEKLAKGKAFLLRVGRHGGAESNTLTGQRHIKIMQGRGEKPIFLSAPLTDWLAATHRNEQNALLPFGWILVEVVSLGTQLEPTLASMLDALNEKRYQQYQGVQDSLQHIKQQWETAQAEAQAKAEEMSAQVLREAERAAEEALTLAAMTAEQQALYGLRKQYEQAKNANNRDLAGELRVKLNDVVKVVVATNDAELKSTLEVLAMEICDFWGVSLKKNKKLKELIRSIKQ